MTSPQPRPFGKYFLLDRLAVGGMAEIFRAKTFGVDQFEKIVVIKKILPHWAADPEFIRMLVDEAKLAALLNHPNIVQVFDLGSVDNDYYIAMEYVDGLDLKNLLAQVFEQRSHVPPDMACYITVQVLAALAYAHGMKDVKGEPLHIIHRDISPHNVLLSYQGEVKLTDFGIAKAAFKKSFTSTGVLKGKLSYMSPEQVRSQPLTAASDLFSVGILLYEMLAGQKCFYGDTEISIIDKIRNWKIDLEGLPENLPEQLKSVLFKALAPEIEDRYASAEAMQEDLVKILAELHPGFLARDLREYLKSFNPGPVLVDPYPPTLFKDQSGAVSQQSSTAIAHIPSHLPGGPSDGTRVLADGPQKKKGRLGAIVLFSLLFTVIAVGSYFVWQNLIKDPREKPKQESSEPKVVLDHLEDSPKKNNESQPRPPDSNPQSSPLQPDSKPSETGKALLKIDSTPKGAKIFLDGKDTGLETPADLEVPLFFEHQLAIVKAGHQAWNKSFTLVREGVVPVLAELEIEVLGKALIVSMPEGAKIFLDGKDTGLLTPATLEDLSQEPHQIRLEKEGYLTLEAVFIARNGEVGRLDLPLKEAPKVVKPPPGGGSRGPRNPSGGGGTPPGGIPGQRPPPGYEKGNNPNNIMIGP